MTLFLIPQADKLQALVDAAGIDCESIWSNIFAKALQGKDLSSFFLSIGSAPAAGAASTSGMIIIFYIDE